MVATPGEPGELARDEISGMVGHVIQKPGFALGIAQGSDSLDVNVGNFSYVQNLRMDSRFSHLAGGA